MGKFFQIELCSPILRAAHCSHECEGGILPANRSKISANVSKLLSQGKYDKAMAEMARLVEDDPADHRTLLRMAETYAKMGRPIDAIQTYENVANQYTAEGFHMKAIAVYKQMLRVDTNLTSAHKALAEQYHALGMQKDCITHYEITASLLERGGRLREALAIFRRMVEQQPENIASRVKLADYLVQQRMKSDAVREYQAAAEYAQQSGLTDEYLMVAEKWWSVAPTNLNIGRNLGRLYLQRADPEKALGKLQQCFQQDPEDVETLPMVAEAFAALEQHNKAAAVYKELARVFQKKGMHADAKSSWRKVLEIIHDDKEAKEALGDDGEMFSGLPTVPEMPAMANSGIPEMLKEVDVFKTYGLQKKAVELMQEVVSLDPKNLSYHVRLYDLLREVKDVHGLAGVLQKMIVLADVTQDGRKGEWQSELNTLKATLQEAQDDSVELEVALAADLPGSVNVQADQDIAPNVQVSVDEVLGQFKEGVKKSIEDDDAETHFELGIAYKEMGLFNEAKDAFHLASQSKEKEVDAHHMTAVVLMDEGDTEKAIMLFDAILQKPNLSSSQQGANWFQKGLCHQRLQQVDQAIAAFKSAADTGENIPGLQARIDLLSNALG